MNNINTNKKDYVIVVTIYVLTIFTTFIAVSN